MTDPAVQRVAEGLSERERAALQPCAPDRRCLVRKGLGHWTTKVGHRFPSIKLSSLGYAVRTYLTQHPRPEGDHE